MVHGITEKSPSKHPKGIGVLTFQNAKNLFAGPKFLTAAENLAVPGGSWLPIPSNLQALPSTRLLAQGTWPRAGARKVTQALFTRHWQGCTQGGRNMRPPHPQDDLQVSTRERRWLGSFVSWWKSRNFTMNVWEFPGKDWI